MAREKNSIVMILKKDCDDSKEGTCVEFKKGGETILSCSGIRCYTNPIVVEIEDGNENDE